MAQTLANSTMLDRTIDRWSNALILCVFLIVISGSLLLVKRIVLPIVALSQTTEKFGRGEFDARTEVLRNDEFGFLCKSFNSMAENIQALQEERLHFIAAVAHDLKNPLILVGATARRLKKKLAIGPDHMELVDRLIEQSSRAEEMISDLMESVQMQTGKLALNMEEIDVDSLVSTIHRHQSALIATHEIQLEGECRSWIIGDARRLERVLANLISNAVKYSPKHSLVRIRVEQRGAEAVISVSDEGAGIPAVNIPTLFQPFQRLAHTRDMAKGTGLGLFSAKKIIDSHGGTISISSEPGKGTTVTIALPIVVAG
jgi:signal transduction histidine kinase